jgi:hypothetical protein
MVNDSTRRPNAVDVLDPKREAGISPNRTQRLRRFLPRSLVVAKWGLSDILEQTSPLLGVLPRGFPYSGRITGTASGKTPIRGCRARLAKTEPLRKSIDSKLVDPRDRVWVCSPVPMKGDDT